jgi:hypothetical protein
LRACGAPSKSSIELALLNDVAGLGGAPAELPGGVGKTAPVDTDRGIAGGGAPSEGGAGLADTDGGAPAEEDGRLPEAPACGGVAIAGGGPPLPLIDLLGGAEPFGGGGVPRVGAALPGSFLLTHFFSSVS